MTHLASALRSLREAAGLTQEELAERAGLSTRTVSDVERGLRKRLYLDTAQRLVVALGLAGDNAADFIEITRGRGGQMRTDLDAEFRRRYVAWHVDRVSALAAQVGSEELWFAVLDADRANLAVALRWADEAGDTDSLLGLATALFRYWQARGDLAIGRDWLERGLGAAKPAAPTLRMAALWAVAWLAYHQGDDDRAAECGIELSDLADDLDDPVGRRNAETVSGIVALSAGDTARAVQAFGEALRFLQGTDQPWLVATSLLNLGIAHIGAGQTDEARRLITDALGRYAELGDERFRARSLGYLGLASLVDGDPVRARALCAQSLAMFDVLGEEKGISEALTGLATAAAMSDQPERAARLGGAAERIRESYAGRAFPVEGRLAEIELGRVRSTVEDDVWQGFWTAGRALREDEAVAFALA